MHKEQQSPTYCEATYIKCEALYLRGLGIKIGLRPYFQGDAVGRRPKMHLLLCHNPSQNIIGVGQICQTKAHLAYQLML